MHNLCIVKVFYIIIVIALIACKEERTSTTSSKKYSKHLISVVQANTKRNNNPGQYKFIQVSPAEIFKKGHIPNALNIWRPDYTSGLENPVSGLKPSHQELQHLLQNLGIQEKDTLVLYDHKGNVDALRFAWVLSYYGYDKYLVIDGGLKSWTIAKMAVDTSDATLPTPSNLSFAPAIKAHALATFDEVRNRSSNTLLVDTREPYEFLGKPFLLKDKVYKHKKGAYIHGHIPGAIHFNWSILSDLKGDHKIKPYKDLVYDLQKAGITKDKKIILYCHSGSRTSHTYFVLTELLGYRNVKNYDGSWIEWSYKNKLDSSVPITQNTNALEFDSLFNHLHTTFKTNG